MNESLQSEILDRLERRIELPDKISELVLAALADEVESHLGGKTPTKPTPKTTEPKDPVRAYIDSTTVEGFRGIGLKASLSLTPGPGLTLVVGRNGSGKSSFAEGLEPKGTKWKLDIVEGLVAGRKDDGHDTTGAVLRELIQLQGPSDDWIAETVKTLRQAIQAQRANEWLRSKTFDLVYLGSRSDPPLKWTRSLSVAAKRKEVHEREHCQTFRSPPRLQDHSKHPQEATARRVVISLHDSLRAHQ